MHGEQVLLQVPEEAARLIEDGKAYRIGGVVREAGTGRIVALLEDADPTSERLAGPSAVPLSPHALPMEALAGRLEARLDAIQAELADLRQIAEETRDLAALTNAWQEANALGGFVGLLRACRLDVEGGRHDLLLAYRRDFIVAQQRFLAMAFQVLRDPGLLKVGARLLRELFTAAALATVAARDLARLLGDDAGDRQLALEAAAQAGALAEELRRRLDAPSALFWLTDAHLDLDCDGREIAARLKGHAERLLLLAGEGGEPGAPVHPGAAQG